MAKTSKNTCEIRELKISRRTCTELFTALSNLDGYTNPKEQEIERFEYTDAAAWAIACNLDTLKTADKRIDGFRKKLFNLHAKGKTTIEKNSKAFRDYQEALEAYYDTEIIIRLRLFKKEDLNMKDEVGGDKDGNNIPPTVLSALKPIISDFNEGGSDDLIAWDEPEIDEPEPVVLDVPNPPEDDIVETPEPEPVTAETAPETQP